MEVYWGKAYRAGMDQGEVSKGQAYKAGKNPGGEVKGSGTKSKDESREVIQGVRQTGI